MDQLWQQIIKVINLIMIKIINQNQRNHKDRFYYKKLLSYSNDVKI